MSVYREKTNNNWFVKTRYRTLQNEEKWATKRGFHTKREALNWEREFLMEKSNDLHMGFAQFVTIYKNDMEPRLKEGTWATKTNIIESKLLPYFGDLPLCDITPAHVVQWQNQLLCGPYASTYLKTVHNQLSAIFNHAIRLYGLKSNPARVAGNLGSKEQAEMKFWTKEQYLAFSEEMMEHPIAYYAFQILYWCGLREGELLALTRADVDLDSGTINVDKTYLRLHGRDIISSPKTPTSRRTVQMPDFLVDELNDYFSMLYGLSRDQRIFQISKDYLQRKLARGAEQAGLPRIRVHDLRHSHVSLLIHMGYHAVAIAQRVGHKSIDITYRYAHLFPSVQVDIAKQLDAQQEVL